VLLLSGWHDFRPHHLLPTFPLLALLLAAALVRFRERRPSIATLIVVALVVAAGVYAGLGAAGYATMPRDQAENWLAANAGDDEEMEMYTLVMQDAAIPHGMTVDPHYQGDGVAFVGSCPEYVQLTHRDLLHLSDDPVVDRNDRHAAYVRSLLEGENGYEIAAEFGDRPPGFVPQRPRPGSLAGLLEVGVVPQSPDYADEQELAPDQYTVILQQTGECDRAGPESP
ncbi:MAG: dolichyl-phosphate-mannose--protein mannosyltransferase, partial [Halodesulfurarchaeum sp.]